MFVMSTLQTKLQCLVSLVSLIQFALCLVGSSLHHQQRTSYYFAVQYVSKGGGWETPVFKSKLVI